MRAQFVMSEMGVGLRRNLTMTVAVVLTVAISLMLLGIGWLMHRQVNAMKTYWYGKIEVSVFLANNVTEAEREQIQSTLTGLPQVQRVYYESKQQAYQRFKHDFAGERELVKNTDPSALPESFRVKLKDPTQFRIVASAVSGLPGVDTVNDEQQVLKPLFAMMHGLQTAAWTIAIIALLSAILLLFNTIRVAAYGRRRETGIMRLVGASQFYIQLPFVLEGSLAGLVGAGLAALGLAVFESSIVHGVIQPDLKFITFAVVGWHDVLVNTLPYLFVLGIGLSAVASFVTLQRYVRV